MYSMKSNAEGKQSAIIFVVVLVFVQTQDVKTVSCSATFHNLVQLKISYLISTEAYNSYLL